MNHLKFTSSDMHHAQWAIITGNPFRLELMANSLLSDSHEIFWDREYRCWVGRRGKLSFLFASHGIGGPSTSILMEEMALLGVRHVIRMGTSGSIQPKVLAGDLVVTLASVRLDGASRHYAPLEYPAVADPAMSLGLYHAAVNAAHRVHMGITASSDTFYPGQERYDSFGQYVIRDFQGSMEEWQRLHVLNYEMESATLLTMGQVMDISCACITGIVAQRCNDEKIDESIVQKVEQSCIESIGIYLDTL